MGGSLDAVKFPRVIAIECVVTVPTSLPGR
jgi:hypothetical protein